MSRSKIEWTDKTCNPIRARRRVDDDIVRVGWHCEKVSPGCASCYAERGNRWIGTGLRYAVDQRAKVELFLDGKALEEPLRATRPWRWFLCSMTDLFADFVSDDWVDEVLAVVAATPWHRYQILTKRAARMRALLSVDRRQALRPIVERILASGAVRGNRAWAHGLDLGGIATPWPLPNLSVGVSVEDRATAEARIPELLYTPAAAREVSYEPALEWVDFWPWIDGIDRVIVGGESGTSARPFRVSFAARTIEVCAAARKACFVKQLGGNAVNDVTEVYHPDLAESRWPAGARFDSDGRVHLKHAKGGDPSEWPPALRVRQEVR